MKTYSLPQRIKGRRPAGTLGLLGAIGVSLGVFCLLSGMQKTGDPGEKVVRSFTFRLPEVEAPAPPPPPPPTPKEIKPKPIPQRKPQTSKTPPPAARRSAQRARSSANGVPRTLLVLGLDQAPAFVVNTAMDVCLQNEMAETYQNAHTLLERELAQMDRRRDRGACGSQSRPNGIRPARQIDVDFPPDAYPKKMFDANVECLVVTRVRVSPEGLVKTVEVLTIRPHPGKGASASNLDTWKSDVEETLQSVSRHWRFRAAVDLSSDLPVEDTLTINILFEITT
jgi:hypothetical protein